MFIYLLFFCIYSYLFKNNSKENDDHNNNNNNNNKIITIIIIIIIRFRYIVGSPKVRFFGRPVFGIHALVPSETEAEKGRVSGTVIHEGLGFREPEAECKAM